jgi:hypothetical protein
VFFTPKAAAGKAWRGIVPLHSTRSDVERLLGSPNVEDWGYDIDDERALIAYSTHGCEEGLPGGWSVPPNTVIEIDVRSSKDIQLDDVLMPGRTYDQVRAVHTQQVYYLDVAEGVRYTTLAGALQVVSYVGSEADEKKFRCGEYKYAAPALAGAKNKFEQYPYDSYGKIAFQDAKSRLDTFVFQLLELNGEKPVYRGFIIVYAGQSAYAEEAKTIAECSKNYLVKDRKSAPESIVAVDGGYREEFKVELYIMPNDAYPPLLMPTVSPRKVELLPGAFAYCKE